MFVWAVLSLKCFFSLAASSRLHHCGMFRSSVLGLRRCIRCSKNHAQTYSSLFSIFWPFFQFFWFWKVDRFHIIFKKKSYNLKAGQNLCLKTWRKKRRTVHLRDLIIFRRGRRLRWHRHERFLFSAILQNSERIYNWTINLNNNQLNKQQRGAEDLPRRESTWMLHQHMWAFYGHWVETFLTILA